ncbi:hypothetical protein PUNSTDRAFT_126734 [Punctularia strigosozonata HHB-11173 SS5]|uniref:uncharacterized protein n=1 Tax=Punctularia strigosozonata (strain HHB-11173) TaxID=741275 RepID=UPI0004418160|nr:uncharacterized protein PUNSTDRAFT_126734 [Punctularia strigosozonata HHB-11173 SS5]EIN07839.1 hypothetical protein PUNSTDRAFT_126734 [Punctularia strigosozonata HHB-11173 SS5]
MTSPNLGSFNPFAVHPFTNGAGVPPQPAQPSPYALHSTSTAYARTSRTPSSTPSSSPATTPSSTPPSSGSPIVMVPTAHRKRQTSSKPQPQPIFEPFRPDGRASPELGDIVTKRKVVQAWGLQSPRSSGSSKKA